MASISFPGHRRSAAVFLAGLPALCLAVSSSSFAAEPPAPRRAIEPDPSRKGLPVFISEGKVPIQALLEFLSDYTGLPVLHDSADPAFETKEIRIVSAIREADAEMVKALLEVNGIRVFRAGLPGGKKILKAQSLQADPLAGDDPRPWPIIRVAPDGKVRDVYEPSGSAAGDAGTEARLKALEAKVDAILAAIQEIRGAIAAMKDEPRGAGRDRRSPEER